MGQLYDSMPIAYKVIYNRPINGATINVIIELICTGYLIVLHDLTLEYRAVRCIALYRAVYCRLMSEIINFLKPFVLSGNFP